MEVSSKQWIGLHMNFICMFVPKGWNSHYIHILLDWLWKVFMHYWLTFGQAFMQVFMPYWNFEYTNTVTLHCGKSGRRYRFCNWGNPFWVKLTSSFFQWINCIPKCDEGLHSSAWQMFVWRILMLASFPGPFNGPGNETTISTWLCKPHPASREQTLQD